MATKIIVNSDQRVGFGSQSARFQHNGVHPNMLNTGRMPYDVDSPVSKMSTKLGPGSYDLLRYNSFDETNVARRAEGPNWERAMLTERLAKMPYLLYREMFKKKQEDKRRLGPGYYNASHVDETKPHSTRGMLDALSSRFHTDLTRDYPGPGSYGVPDEKLEEKRKNKPGKVPVMERSKEERSLPLVGSEVAPGTYTLKDSVAELLKKRVSTRGPYDVFSENRSAPIKTGHYAEDTDNKLGPGQYEKTATIDELKKAQYVKHGKFGKIAQYPTVGGDRLSIEHTSLRPRNPSWPGPAHYSPGEISEVVSHTPAFHSSSSRNDKRSQMFLLGNFNPVGVARYDIQKGEDFESKNGHSSIFKSKSVQITSQKAMSYLAERLKPHNLDKDEKINLFLTGTTHG